MLEKEIPTKESVNSFFMQIEKEKQNFIEHFKELQGFYNLTPLNDAFGFSVKRKLNDLDGNASILDFFISDKEINNNNDQKNLTIMAHYGKELEDGILVKDKLGKILEPIDLISNDYIYDFNTNNFFYEGKKIFASQIIEDIYQKHIKPTKLLKGFWLRVKLIFWRAFLPNISDFLSKYFFHYLLYLMTGDKYRYEPILGMEIVNDLMINYKSINSQAIRSKFNPAPNIKYGDQKTEEHKIEFLGYRAAFQPVIFFSIIHLLGYFISSLLNIKPKLIITVFKNNFLTLIYVISFLWSLEILIPIILKSLIRFFSRLAISSLHHRVII